MAQIFTQDNFAQEVLKAETPVLVDFWAPWCGPCRIVGPIVEELAAEYAGKPIKIGKLNVDENNAVAMQFGIMSIPTLIIFKNGAPHTQLVGAQSKDKLKEAIEKALSV